MNFIKRTGVILMVFAIVASSCNKHLVEESQWNPDRNIPGVVSVLNDINTLRKDIVSVKSATESMPEAASTTALKTGLIAISAKTDTVFSRLNKLAINNAISNALLEGLIADLTALPAKIAAENITLKTQIYTIGNSNNILLARLNALVEANAALITQITSIQKKLYTMVIDTKYTTFQIVTDAMQVQMQATKVSFDILLATYMPN